MWENLSVEVRGKSIVVTMPGTDFAVTHEKLPDTPNLVLIFSSVDTSITSSAVSQFRARAFHATVDKARELGWIV